ncbi:MAG: hypothetical protein AB1668_03680 [Nanoarchaeota archaeon]
MSSALKEHIHKRIPSHIKKEPHFRALLDHIKEQNIETAEHLKDFLEKQISLVEGWLENNKHRSETSVKSVRDKKIQLDVLKKCYNLTQEFLL